jgi:hypothetical protein
MEVPVKTLIFWLAMGFSLCGFAQESVVDAAKDPDYVMCKLGGSVRTIRVDVSKNGACKATYTKEGIDQVVAKSGTDDVCRNVMKNIKENLSKANWKCRDISSARVSSTLTE